MTPDGDRLIIGKCADLERLGQAKLNPFMTSCGAISTLERAAEAAEHLGVDPERQELWRRTAAALRKSLPRGNGRYLPCPDAEPGSSIALLSGLYPYGTLPAEDPAQRQAAEDYFAREQEFGNMYPEGNAICSWYANWKALALARLGRRAEARVLPRNLRNTGDREASLFHHSGRDLPGGDLPDRAGCRPSGTVPTFRKRKRERGHVMNFNSSFPLQPT